MRKVLALHSKSNIIKPNSVASLGIQKVYKEKLWKLIAVVQLNVHEIANLHGIACPLSAVMQRAKLCIVPDELVVCA